MGVKIYLGFDHQGFHLKDKVLGYLVKRGYDVEDLSGDSLDLADDFPVFAQAVSAKVLSSSNRDPRGVLICGGGQGMAMAANRFKGIRASVVWDSHEAKMTRHDNDSNVISLPARVVSQGADSEWQDILETWLTTKFADASRFRRRNAEIDELV